MDVEDEIFEESNEIVEPTADETKVVEAKAEPAEVVAAPTPEPAETAPKKIKKKRVITDAERERLRANLAKGRATSLAKRRKKAQLKKIALEAKTAEEDEKIFQSYKKKRSGKELAEENDSLRQQLAELKAAAKPKEVVKPVKVKEKKVKSAATEDSGDEMIQVRTKSIIIEDEKKASPPIKKVIEKKAMSQREILKMMRGL